MGLDMYLYARSPKACIDDTEIGYWRKHPNLHGLMETIWDEKGKPGLDPEEPAPSPWGFSDFNGIPLELTLDDIDRVISQIKENKLPFTEGFFFGHSDGSEKKKDLKIFREAKKLAKQGYTIIYNSSW